ncbi:MAG: hypothetical protein LQ351_002495 [Letrouitia transgressa]|nr:MAG: hypothetical protein LQ351_002495 [Letrouitia transgressa]
MSGKVGSGVRLALRCWITCGGAGQEIYYDVRPISLFERFVFVHCSDGRRLVGRTVQGIGGGGILTLGEIVITDLIPLSVRGAWFGFIGGIFAIGTVVGPLMGGGGIMFAWDSWHTLVPLLLGVAGIIAFTFYEYILSTKAFDSEGVSHLGNDTEPIIRFSIFSNWTLRLVYLQTLVHGIVLWSLLYFLPLYYQGVKGYSPIITGIAVLPETFLIAPVSIITGVVSSSLGRYRWAIWLSWSTTTLGCGLLYLLSPSTRVPAFVLLNIPVSIGTGMAFNSMSLAIQAAGRPQDAAHSITFYSFIRVFGQALGVAVGGVVFQNQIQTKLSAYPSLAPLAGEYSMDATALVGIIQKMDNSTEKTQLVQAYADSIKMIWVVMAALSGAVFVSSAFVKGYSLNQELETSQGLKHRDGEKES